MKSIVFILVLFPGLVAGQCDPEGNGVLSAMVQDHSVTLRNDTVNRNCGASYTMGISLPGSDTLIWMQNDTGGVAYCYCNFNLSVTIDSLSPGNYVVMAYYNDLVYNDTCYIGSVRFTITQPENYPAPTVINPWQSECFTLGIKGPDVNNVLPPVFPNPATEKLFFRETITAESTIQISDARGLVLRYWSADLLLNGLDIGDLKPGLYFLRIIPDGKFGVMRFIKI